MSGLDEVPYITPTPYHACQHGQLAWQCPLCEKDQEIERLRDENNRLRALAKFGKWVMKCEYWSKYWPEQVEPKLIELGLWKVVEVENRVVEEKTVETDLAQLPEES